MDFAVRENENFAITLRAGDLVAGAGVYFFEIENFFTPIIGVIGEADLRMRGRPEDFVRVPEVRFRQARRGCLLLVASLADTDSKKSTRDRKFLAYLYPVY